MRTDLIPGVPDVTGARSDRIRRHTPQRVNEEIDLVTNARSATASALGRDAIIARIQLIDREWDVERALLATIGLAGITTFLAGRLTRRLRYLALGPMFGALGAAVFGWAPPLPFLRRLGVRTSREIAAERYALVRKLEADYRLKVS